jgi:hypothetical protein
MLKAKNVLDRERIPVYTLGIEARDRGTPSRSSTIVVQVSVLDKNDNAPVFTENPKNCEIDENSAMNSRVCSVSAMDSDDGINSVVTYELVTPSSTFSVDQVCLKRRQGDRETGRQVIGELDSNRNFRFQTVFLRCFRIVVKSKP